MVTAEELKSYITQELLLEPEMVDLKEDDELLTTGLIDSLGIMRLIAFIEEKNGSRIPNNDITIEHFRSVRAIEEYLQTREAAG